ncbi:MAG: HK97 family phage prohead protease [Bacteroides sp.]|nr:HK97 family phage prohead protease [Eubacterium sp.]MCM1419516.1 HK97 family phage prohead protease [Roseburia sp.]MCM1463446.1 HK97 family phage prohead protease [Bacteroides sp.]
MMTTNENKEAEMKIEIRNGKARISGYVNAVGRDSRPIPIPTGGEFVEMIEPGVFREALTRAKNVDMLLNHDRERVLASTGKGDLRLREDAIGLYAECETADAEVVQKARNGDLRGWSFGMFVNKDEMEQRAEKPPRRHVRNMDLFEVSIIDKRMLPCYAGTSVECRADGRKLSETRTVEDAAEMSESGEESRKAWQERIKALSAAARK